MTVSALRRWATTCVALAVEARDRRVAAVADARGVRPRQYEFAFPVVLARSAGRVFSRDRPIERIGRRDRASDDREINVLVGRISQKIAENPSDPRIVITAQGVG